MSDPATVAGQVAGPLGYYVANVLKTSSSFGSEESEKPFVLKMAEDVAKYVKPFTASAEDKAEDAMDAVQDAGTGADLVDENGTSTKGYSLMDWVVFGLTILAIVVSWTLNNDKNVRAKLGFSGDSLTAGIFVSMLSILAIFLLGPWLYFAFLLIPLFQFVPMMDTPGRRYWIEGIKDAAADVNVPTRDKSIIQYLKSLPAGMQSGVPEVPLAAGGALAAAKFGHFYY